MSCDGVIVGHVVSGPVGDSYRIGVFFLAGVGDGSRDLDLGRLSLRNRACFCGDGFIGQSQAVVDLGCRAAEQGQTSLENRQISEGGRNGIVGGNVLSVCCVYGCSESVLGGSRYRLLACYHDNRRFSFCQRSDENVRLLVRKGQPVVDLGGGFAGYGDGPFGYRECSVDQSRLVVGGHVDPVRIQNMNRKRVFGGPGADLGAREGYDHGVSFGKGSVLQSGCVLRERQTVVFLGGRGADYRKASCRYGQCAVHGFDHVVGGHVRTVLGLYAEHGGVFRRTVVCAHSRKFCGQGLAGYGFSRNQLPRVAAKGGSVVRLDRRIGLYGQAHPMHL